MRRWAQIPLPVWLLVLVGVGMRLYFWVRTDFTIDDAYITLRHATNLLKGNGPVPFPGVHVQGFSSPLALLVQAIGELVGIGGITLLKTLSIVLSGVSILLAWRLSTGDALRMGRWAGYLWCALLAVHVGLVRWVVGGLEGGLVVFMLLGMWTARFAQRPFLFGTFVALLALARPDAALLAFPVFAKDILDRRFPFIAKAAIAAFAFYAPWLIFSTAFYGSPLPQSVVAKALETFNPLNSTVFSYVMIVVGISGGTSRGFEPWWVPNLVFPIFAVLPLSTLIAYGLVRTARRGGPGTALALGTVGYGVYVAFIAPASWHIWYYIPMWVSSTLFIAVGADGTWDWMKRTRHTILRYGIPVYSMTIVFTFLAVGVIKAPAFSSVYVDYLQEVGLSLKALTSPDAVILMEPAGTVPYYSERRTIDSYGITSPEVTRIFAEVPRSERSMLLLLQRLKPDYVLLQTAGVLPQGGENARLDDDYVFVHRFTYKGNRKDFPVESEFSLFQRVDKRSRCGGGVAGCRGDGRGAAVGEPGSSGQHVTG